MITDVLFINLIGEQENIQNIFLRMIHLMNLTVYVCVCTLFEALYSTFSQECHGSSHVFFCTRELKKKFVLLSVVN